MYRLRKNPDERPSAEALLKKRLFVQQTAYCPPRRASTGPTVSRKNLGSLAVYATPLLPRRSASVSTPVKRKSHTNKRDKNCQKTSPRRRWNPPTHTLISALSSLGLSEDESTTINPPSYPSNDDDWQSSDGDEITFDDSVNLMDRTCVLRVQESEFHRLERWLKSLEETFGTQLLKLGNHYITQV